MEVLSEVEVLSHPRRPARSPHPQPLLPAELAALASLPAPVRLACVAARAAGHRGWAGVLSPTRAPHAAHVVLDEGTEPGELTDTLTEAGYVPGWLCDGHRVWTADGAALDPVGSAVPWWRCDDASELLRRAIRHDRKRGVLAACACARTALHHVPAGELRPLRAIEAAEAWCRGEATIEQVREARDAAWARYAAAYAAAAAAYAAGAAGAATTATATTTAAYAASDAATALAGGWGPTRRVELARLADLVRLTVHEP